MDNTTNTHMSLINRIRKIRLYISMKLLSMKIRDLHTFELFAESNEVMKKYYEEYLDIEYKSKK